jgi:hypothetical protein
MLLRLLIIVEQKTSANFRSVSVMSLRLITSRTVSFTEKGNDYKVCVELSISPFQTFLASINMYGITLQLQIWGLL